MLTLDANSAEGTVARPLLPALPSDNYLIESIHLTRPDDELCVEVTPPSVWRAAFRLGISPAKAMGRLAELGFSLAECEHLPPPAEINSADVILIESDFDFADNSSRRSRTDPHAQLIIASARLDKSMAQVAQRLAELGLDSPRTVPSGRADGTDVRLISNYRGRSFDASNPCLDHKEPVSALYVLLAARATGLAPSDAAIRLRRLGLDVPDFDVTLADLESLPRPLRKAVEEVNEYGQRPLASQVCREALTWRCQPGDLVRTLHRFGIVLDKQLPERLTATDKALLPPSTRPTTDRLGLREFLRALLKVNLTVHESAARIKAMGFDICETAHLKQAPDARDREILSGIVSNARAEAVGLREFCRSGDANRLFLGRGQTATGRVRTHRRGTPGRRRR
jgi:hypothetical protein